MAIPFLLTQCDRESRRLELLRPQDLDLVAGGSNCDTTGATIGGFTICTDEDHNVHTDSSDIND